MEDLPIGVVGGGIVGLALARELTRRHPGQPVRVFEKEERLGAHQTGHNSGVVHAGIYYPPGSLKAELCTRGRVLLREFCHEHDLPYEQCGKLVVAVDQAEVGRLRQLEENARSNGVPDLRWVDAEGIAEVEPHAVGAAALHSPVTAITDYELVTAAMARDVEAAGGTVSLDTSVQGVARVGGAVEVRTATGRHRVRQLVLCAGLQSDRLVPAGRDDDLRIVPFRGEYMEVRRDKRDLVRGMIYPVPDPRYPFLGVHFTRQVSGALELGPNAVLALHREGYGRWDADLRDVWDILRWPGFWRLAAEHWRAGVAELLGFLSKRVYVGRARRYVPAIGPDDVVRHRSGIRAQAVDRAGSLVDDFRIHQEDGIVSVGNAPSPAATSSLAIAQHVADLLEG